MNICTKFEQLRCALCLQKASNYLCEACHHDLPWIKYQCSLCQRPMESEHLICPHCQDHPPAFDSVHVPLCYEKPISQLIWRFKFEQQRYYGHLLCDLFLKRYPNIKRPDLIIPMPMHPLRVFVRTFNQTIALGAHLSRALKVPMDTATLIRQHSAPSQRLLSQEQRKKNLAHTFKLKGSVEGLRVVLLDDVITTGYSAHYASECLKHGGAKHVDLWAMAATPIAR